MLSHHITAPRRRAGFTLIELLTVIAIIGILAAIIVPVVGKVRQTAKTSGCSVQLRQISMALVLYQQDNKGILPIPSDSSTSIIWQKALRPYLPLKGTTDTSRVHQVFTCPSAEYNGFDNASLAHTYAATGAILGTGASGNPSTYGSSTGKARPYSSIAEPSRTPWIVDAKSAGAGKDFCDSSIKWADASADMSAATIENCAKMDFRHNNSMNAAYADGSVRLLKFADFKLITQDRWNGR